MKKISLAILISIISSTLFAQVIISGLQTNSALEKIRYQSTAKGTQTANYTPISLPFVDDFSTTKITPDTARWINNYVFINNDYAYKPPTIGVATFDALDGFGNIYSTMESDVFSADTLTSRPIRLDSIYTPSKRAITLADSIYLSFFVQPGGGIGQPWELRGDRPETGDSLVLEFGHFTGDSSYALQPQIITTGLLLGDSVQYQCDTNIWIIASHSYQINDTMMVEPCDTLYTYDIIWQKAWGIGGSTLKQLYDSTGKYFKQVMIPILNPQYLNERFQFRFRNYASMGNNALPGWQGNVDQWNIDYVKLDIGRTASDTLLKDVAFACSAPTTLKNYQAMPWTQFKGNQSELADSMNILLTNLDNSTKNTSYTYTVSSATGAPISNYDGGSFNLDPYDPNGYQTYQPHAHPPITFTYPEDAQDSASFIITHIFKEAGFGDQNNNNDTIRQYQNFHNYYAYDDGTAENGFGISPAGARLAYKFTLNTADTLRAVNMFFNRTMDKSNVQYFWLSIWNDAGGKPGSLIYEQNSMSPKFGDSLNQFLTYELNEPVAVAGTFYIGWRQTTDNNLNIGFDRNNNASANIFYNSSGTWENTFYTGALMMRPMLGQKFSGVNINENAVERIQIYPNPISNNLFSASFNDSGRNLTYKITDLIGRMVDQNQLKQTNEIHLQTGIYLIQIMDATKTIHTQKLLINN